MAPRLPQSIHQYRNTIIRSVSGWRLLSSLLVVLCGGRAFAEAPTSEQPPLTSAERTVFEGKIRPLLESHCLRCHSEKEGKRKGDLLLDRRAGWQTGGDSGGAVIDLEHPEKSLLYRMVEHDPDVEAMPPKSKLSQQERDDLLAWITMGAPDPRSESLDETISHNDFDLEDRKSFWSLQPLQNVTVPKPKDADWGRTDVDAFLRHALEEKGWTPAKPADKATLLRRASITLTGLAPTPAELQAFLDDEKDDAFEREVDRLLASPHFGERFARHWMDVVRFANSKAFEADYLIPYAAEFRDYLIRAFNEDVPFDQLVREAFAGDLLSKPRIKDGINESIIGPGGLLFIDGQHGPPDIHEDEARVFDGIINTASTAFQSLTVACARCHDHKFDAITAADYYSLYGMLRSSRFDYGNCSAIEPATLTTLEDVTAKAEADLLASVTISTSVVTEAMALLDNPEIEAAYTNAFVHKDEKHRTAARPAFDEALAKFPEDVASWYPFLRSAENIPELNALRRALTGKGPVSKQHPSGTPITWREGDGTSFKRVENRLILSNDPAAPVRAGVDAGWVAGLLSPRVDGRLRSEDFILNGEDINFWVAGVDVSVNLIIRNYEMPGRGPTTGGLRVNPRATFGGYHRFRTEYWAGEPAYVEVLHHGGGNGMRCGTHGGNPNDNAFAIVADAPPVDAWNAFWKDTTAESAPTVIRTLFAEDGQAELKAALIKKRLVTIPKTPAAFTEMVTLRETLPKPRYVRTLTEGKNYHEPVYVRGNHKTPAKQENPKHFLDAYGGQTIGQDGSGRLEYAEHLLTTSAPLTARVRVNRLWARVFGRGLVASVDDFGVMGETPSHPELLDFLAARFIEDGWSTKTLLRELVTSSAFRMSSVPGDGVRENDPKNTRLQHMPLQRMDAETIRDHIIHVTGDLNRKVFGPIVSSRDQSRRSLYLDMRRNNLPAFLRTFDLPLFTEPTGLRKTSTVPAQSLALMNDPFTHGKAGRWARNLRQPTDEEKIQAMHLAAFSRPATDEEIAWGKEAFKAFGNWHDVCHLMFNRKEFIYVF